MSLRNRTVAVTGAASGIGAASARVLKEQGARVIAFDINKPESDYDEFVQIDLSREESIEEAVAQVAGPLDALANIAGLPPTRPADQVMRVNFFGLRHFTESLVPKLKDGGCIVNMASGAGGLWAERLDTVRKALNHTSIGSADAFCKQNGIDATNVYQFSKEVLIVWTLSSWNRWADRGIRMNSISPGPVETPILSDFLATIVDEAKEHMALVPRPGTTAQIAPSVAFLCDPDNSWINGHNLAVDGGLAAALTATALKL